MDRSSEAVDQKVPEDEEVKFSEYLD